VTLVHWDDIEGFDPRDGFAPLGDANSATKQLIFGGNARTPLKL